jgi:heptosyltransferase-2
MNNPTQTQKILIMGPAWVGDMVMAQTLFSLLKQQRPCHLTVLAGAWARGLVARMPEVDDFIALPFGHGDFKIGARWQFGKTLRGHFDQAIVLTNSWKSAIIPFAAKIPLRTGWRGEMRYGLLNDLRILDKAQYPLMIERFMALGQPFSRNRDSLPQAQWPKLRIDPAEAQSSCAKFGLIPAEKPILSLCPGAEYGPAKRWPTSHFAEVARSKMAEGWQVWIFGSAKEQPLAAEIQAETENACVDLTGKTNLAEALDLLSLASAVVCNDTGLMHMAAALGRPIVAIYGSSSPGFTPPLAKQIEIATLKLSCSPCFARTCRFGHTACLNDLKSAQVLSGIENLRETPA